MGTNFYFRRDDNRTRYFMGKAYELARIFGPASPLTITEGDRPGDICTSHVTARDLAEFAEIASSEAGCWETQIAPTGRDEHGTSRHLLALALDVARWSGGMPISFVDEDDFERWQDDPSWDRNASTARFRAVDLSP